MVEDGYTGRGIGICYTSYNATTGSYTSLNMSCVDDSGVTIDYYDTEECSGSPAASNYTTVEELGWSSMQCGSNYDCVATFTEYENTNASTCDLATASYTESSVVIDMCMSNGTRSAIYGCYGGRPSQRLWLNDDCSGGYDYLGQPSGCDCDYDYMNGTSDCSVTVIDDESLSCDMGEGTVFSNCSYGITDGYIPYVLDRCNNQRENESDYSIYYECVDSITVRALAYNERNCQGTISFNQTVCFHVFLHWCKKSKTKEEEKKNKHNNSKIKIEFF